MASLWANGLNFIYALLFLGTHLQVRPIDGFSCLMAQMTWTHAKMCFLGVGLILLPIYWVNHSPQTIFGACIAVLKPNMTNIEAFILSALRHRSQPNFAQQ